MAKKKSAALKASFTETMDWVRRSMGSGKQGELRGRPASIEAPAQSCLVAEFVVHLCVDLPRVIPVKAAEGQAVVDQQVTVRLVQYTQRRGQADRNFKRPCGPRLPTTLLRVTSLMLRPSLGAARQ
jgi:hypothetical protein